MKSDVSNERVLVVLLSLACLASNLSQLPVLVDAGITQYFNMPVWIVVAVYLLITNHLRISRQSLMYIVSVLLILAGCCLLELFTANSYFSSSIFSCLLLSMFMYFLGNMSGANISSKGLKTICLSYTVSAVILCIAIYFDSFTTGTGWDTMVYAYQAKNSASQIIFTSVVILTFISLKGKWLSNILRIAGIVFQVALLMLIRSRATIVGFLVCIIYIIFTGTFNKRLRYILSAVGVVFIILLITNDSINDIFFNSILFGNRDASDLDSLSSGRVSIISSFPELFKGNWLTGIGSIYFECFPLSAILNFGLIVGAVVLIISYSPIIYSFKWRGNNEYTKMFLIIVIGYMINSIFEGLAPIGPGVKCYFMWLMFGILMRSDSIAFFNLEDK